MIPPPVWSEAQLEVERQKAIALFSEERLQEPLEDYLDAFDESQGRIEELLESTVDLSTLGADATLDILTDPRLLEVFRYLAAPPISADDLRVLADMPSLSRSQIQRAPDDARRVVEIVRQVLDRRRFAWVVEKREASEAERHAAVVASAALMAASRAQTQRRTIGKKQQEAAVKDALKDLNLVEVAPRKIRNISYAPAPGEFCGESVLGTRKGDIIVRLWDHRIMPIECKVSNSATNSVKRLNNDAAVKATSWRTDFGVLQVVPSAVLGGVYKLRNLTEAQDRGLTVFWAHDLKSLTDWIAGAR